MKLSISTARLIVEVLIAVLIVILLLRPQSCTSPQPIARGTADSTIYWKNKYGEAVASQKAIAEQFSVQDARIKHMLDSVAKVYDTKAGRIQEMIVAVSRGVSNLKPVPGTVQVDTLWGDPGCPPIVVNRRTTFASPYYLADVQLGDSNYLRLQTYDTLTALWKIVKEGNLFNRKKYLQFDIHFADTGRVVTGLTTYRRLIKPKEFSLGPEARLMYLDRVIRPLAGISLSRSTGRWDISISGGKDFTNDVNVRTNQWYGEARALFKILRL